MSAWAKVGVKCVCIDATDFRLISGMDNATGFPEVRVVYTVVGTDTLDGQTYLGLRELGWRELSDAMFNARRFRPLAFKPQSLEHDVAQFNHIAGHVRAPEKERA